MTKHDLVRAVAQESGETIRAVESIMDSIGNVLKENLAKKEESNLGFIKIKTVEKASRSGRNPKTGEATTIPARTAVKVVVTKPLKDAANGGAK